jgi:hypothetical protein
LLAVQVFAGAASILPVASGCFTAQDTDAADAADAAYSPIQPYAADAAYSPIQADGAVLYIPPPQWSGSSPVLIAQSEQTLSLALDTSTVYWQNAGGSVYGCPLKGCPSSKPTLLSSLVGPQSGALETLAAGDGIAVFITDSGNELSAFAGGDAGVSPRAYRATTGNGFATVVTDATHAYFVDTVRTVNGYALSYTLYSCPLGAACSSPLKLYALPPSNVYYESSTLGALFVADSEVYFMEATNGGYTLLAISIHGGSARTVCSQLLGPAQALTVAGGYAYFTMSSAPARIYQCKATGGSDPSFFIQDLQPYALANDGTNLYWTNYVNGLGSVVTCPLGATCKAARTVALNQELAFAIAANASSVFWTTSASIYRADQ